MRIKEEGKIEGNAEKEERKKDERERKEGERKTEN